MDKTKTPKVALIHDYLIQYGGAEKTLEAIAELFPEAPIYTGTYSPKNFGDKINSRSIKGPKNFLTRVFTKHLTFLMPLVFEEFDLTQYDLVISDSSCWAKGVITRPDQLHISYIHTPPRFLYGYSVESPARNHWYYKPIIAILDHFLRIWDYCAGQRPDYLITNSETTRKRVKKFYNRYSDVIHPPVDIAENTNRGKEVIQKPYFCSLGRLAPYKNVGLLVEAFNLLGWELKVMGGGPEEKRLKKLALPNVKILGKVSEDEKHRILSNSMGLIFPVVEEDWGIVPLEAMSVGKPVLAHRSGGATETVKEGITGMFFESLEIKELMEALKEFKQKIENGEFDAERTKAYAKTFSKQRFQKEFKEYIESRWKEHARVS
jgi:glycosyltransferase involved in cell wall biosynthesis